MTRKATINLPSAQRLREIADLAEFISNEYWMGERLCPLAIAKAKHITTSFNDYSDAFDGLLEYECGTFHIYGNLRRLEGRDTPRARFTLGHELGHYFIDEHRQALESGQVASHKSFCDYESKNPAEREADHFASNLLLPGERFRRMAAAVAPGLEGILQLANKFGTSVTCTAIRFATLNIRPTALIKWTHDGIAWKWLSGSTREAGLWSVIDSPSKLAPGSATARALANEKPAATFFHNGTTAAAWFPWILDSSSRNVLFIEEAISLGRFGVLTVLSPHGGAFDFNNPL